MTIKKVAELLGEVLRELKSQLETGSYEPGEIRRVNIPKPGGKGERGLRIPNVKDRIVQEAVRQALEPLYEPEFHPNSLQTGKELPHSAEAGSGICRRGIRNGDIDLAKYFDTVNHQRLMARLAMKVEDKRLLILIGKMLKAKVIMPDGVVVETEEGVPQGGPLSPLLSNIVLDELDQELERRKHRFVRYADDCNIFVRSMISGERVMASITGYIEKRLRLKVNQEKSAVANPNERHFLGFRLKVNPEKDSVSILLSKRSQERIDAKVKELTPRNWGSSMKYCIEKLNAYLKGWLGFFSLCTEDVGSALGSLDGHIRRRLRAIQLKHWKRKSTMARKLHGHGVRWKTAHKSVYEGRKFIWVLSNSWAANNGLSLKKFEEWGLVSLKKSWQTIHVNRVASEVQMMLPLG